ncbi:MAG TPA: isoprenoid biosynthesis glyoxalase ElbB [Candidatus Krumholzibacteria bacterium]|nr:isoprenoid biosynthesis glyoxalase ElbB [Candidatus Krumholzibacteria bacterium]
MKKVAVILSGCGVYDGSEIHEACAALLALDRRGAKAVACAPDIAQMHVIDHAAGKPAAGESRRVLAEAARLVRGDIAALSTIDPASVDAVLLPGGFGAAKNLCTFAVAGADCRVEPGVAAFLEAALAQDRPIGAMCIAPVILARVFGRTLAPKLTIGTDPDTAAAIAAMGAEHVDCPATGAVVDARCRIVTTPAYMLAGGIGEVFAGAQILVDRLLELCD